jgi:hypothetical protein
MPDPSPFILPDEMVLRLPFGHRIVIQVCRIGPHHGDWKDFDGKRTGRIRIRRQDPYDEQLDTLRHELEHAVTDFGGVLRKLENDYRAWRQDGNE